MTAMSPEERKERLRLRRAAQVATRRAAGLCLECDRPNEGKALCPEHRQRHNETSWANRTTATARKADRKQKKRRYKRLRRRKLCVACGKVKATAGTNKCDACRLNHKLWHQTYLDRRDGLAPPSPLRTGMRPDIAPIVLDPISEYRDGQILMAVAAVRYVEQFNGIPTRAVSEAFHADKRERDTISQVLKRAVTAGRLRVEHDGDEQLFYPVRHRRAA